jgi:hypothetical protein
LSSLSVARVEHAADRIDEIGGLAASRGPRRGAVQARRDAGPVVVGQDDYGGEPGGWLVPQHFVGRQISEDERRVVQIDRARARREHADVVAGRAESQLVPEPCVRIDFDQEDGCVIRRRL